MSIALYRKYRPKLFGEVTNQNHIKITLQNELQTDHLGHAYLFCGPRGTGKTTLARLLAKACNCTNLQPNGEPCNQCDNCLDIIQNKSMDIIEIDAASHTGVDNVRDNIINNARFTPSKSKYKVFIIDEVHMLSISAFNALLKILEEPPKHVIFVLATTEIQKVPATIMSRCQRFDFKKIIHRELVERLHWICGQEEVKVNDEVLARIAKNAGGCVRDAESLLEQVINLGGKDISLDQVELILPPMQFDVYFDLLKYLLTKDAKHAIEKVNQMVEEGTDLGHFTNSFIEYLRRAMIYRVTSSMTEMLQEMPDKAVEQLIELTKDVSPMTLAQMVEVFMRAKDKFKQSFIVQLPLEVAILELTQNEIRPVAPIVRPPIVNLPPATPIHVEEKKTIVEHITPDNSIADVTPSLEQPSVNNATPLEISIESASSEQVVTVVEEIVKSGSGLSLTFSQILSRWPSVRKSVIDKSMTLGMSLSVAKPSNLVGNLLHLAFLFPLQKERVDVPHNISIIKGVLLQEFGANLDILTVIDPNLKLTDIANEISTSQETIQVEQQEIKDPVGQVLDVFGGVVV